MNEPTPLTPAELDEIEKRAEFVTSQDVTYFYGLRGGKMFMTKTIESVCDVPRLIAEVRYLRAALKVISEPHDTYCTGLALHGQHVVLLATDALNGTWKPE